MLRFTLIAPPLAIMAIMAIVAPSPVFAHQQEDAPATGVEIGTLFGFSRLSSANFIGVPAAIVSTPLNPSLYIQWFPSEQLAIGPEFGWGLISEDGDSVSHLHLGGRGAFFLTSNARTYLLMHGSLVALFAQDDSEASFSAGVGLGQEWRLGPAFVLRTEGRYRRWFDSSTNEISVFLGLGTRLGGK